MELLVCVTRIIAVEQYRKELIVPVFMGIAFQVDVADVGKSLLRDEEREWGMIEPVTAFEVEDQVLSPESLHGLNVHLFV